MQSDFLAFVCFTLSKTSCARAPRAIPTIAMYLASGCMLQQFEKEIKCPKNFCLLRMRALRNEDKNIPRRTGRSTPSLFFMSRASVDSSETKRLNTKLQKAGRMVGFVEDLENAFVYGGGNGLAKYLATLDPGVHFSLPYLVTYKDLKLQCDFILPKDVNRVGILGQQMCRGRPLKTCEGFHNDNRKSIEEKVTSATQAPLECVTRIEADIGGWATSW